MFYVEFYLENQLQKRVNNMEEIAPIDEGIVKELMKLVEEKNMAELNRKIVSSLNKKGVKLREFKWSEYEAS